MQFVRTAPFRLLAAGRLSTAEQGDQAIHHDGAYHTV
jgi:hypothetical protein